MPIMHKALGSISSTAGCYSSVDLPNTYVSYSPFGYHAKIFHISKHQLGPIYSFFSHLNFWKPLDIYIFTLYSFAIFRISYRWNQIVPVSEWPVHLTVYAEGSSMPFHDYRCWFNFFVVSVLGSFTAMLRDYCGYALRNYSRWCSEYHIECIELNSGWLLTNVVYYLISIFQSL